MSKPLTIVLAGGSLGGSSLTRTLRALADKHPDLVTVIPVELNTGLAGRRPDTVIIDDPACPLGIGGSDRRSLVRGSDPVRRAHYERFRDLRQKKGFRK